MVHLQRKGFSVKEERTTYARLNVMKDRLGVPRRLRSCHTGLVKNYIIEGHVPGEVISRLLREKPDVLGLGVPGMPIGSPGMEGRHPQPYSVYAFDRQGGTRIYANISP